MTRMSTLCAVISALVLSASGANAQNIRNGPPVIIRPPPLHLDSIPAHQQQQSIWGVQTNIQHRRDRLQGAPGGSGTKAQ